MNTNEQKAGAQAPLGASARLDTPEPKGADREVMFLGDQGTDLRPLIIFLWGIIVGLVRSLDGGALAPVRVGPRLSPRTRPGATVVPMPRKVPPLDPLYTANDLAGGWGVSRDAVYRIPAKRLPYVSVGPKRGRRRYRLMDILEYESWVTVRGEGR